MRQYACIDLKSFFASVECVERGLDPLTTNLVVADAERTDGLCDGCWCGHALVLHPFFRV